MEIIRTAAECSRFRACCFSSAALRIIHYSFDIPILALKNKFINTRYFLSGQHTASNTYTPFACSTHTPGQTLSHSNPHGHMRDSACKISREYHPSWWGGVRYAALLLWCFFPSGRTLAHIMDDSSPSNASLFLWKRLLRRIPCIGKHNPKNHRPAVWRSAI